MIRVPDDKYPPLVGEWVCQVSMIFSGLCRSPRQVISVSATTVTARDPRPGGDVARIAKRNIAFATPAHWEAVRAFERSERLRQEIDAARKAALADVLAIQ